MKIEGTPEEFAALAAALQERQVSMDKISADLASGLNQVFANHPAFCAAAGIPVGGKRSLE